MRAPKEQQRSSSWHRMVSRARQGVGLGMTRALLQPAACIADRGPGPKEHQRSSSWHGLSGVKSSSGRWSWNDSCTTSTCCLHCWSWTWTKRTSEKQQLARVIRCQELVRALVLEWVVHSFNLLPAKRNSNVNESKCVEWFGCGKRKRSDLWGRLLCDCANGPPGKW